MKTISIFLLFFLTLWTPADLGMGRAELSEGAVSAGEESTITIDAQLKQIKKLRKAKKYFAAQKKMEELLENPSLSKEKKEKIKKDFDDLKREALISQFEISKDKFHNVVAGDTLYDIAKKYKTTVDVIKKSNHLTNDVIYPGMKLKVVSGIFSIQVDKSENILFLYFNGKLIKQYLVATGSKEKPTPVGQFEIINKLENPTWFHAGVVVPPDSPENILGTRWLGFNQPGYGIHGTTMPQTIGKHLSSGCIRMHNEDAEELYFLIPLGTKVTITE
jgi:LysM repeat protein